MPSHAASAARHRSDPRPRRGDSTRPLHHQLYTALRDAILTAGSRPAAGCRPRARSPPSSTCRATRCSPPTTSSTPRAISTDAPARAASSRRSCPCPSAARRAQHRLATAGAPHARRLSGRGRLLRRPAGHAGPRRSAARLPPGVPALDAFPIEAWGRLMARAWKDVDRAHLGYADAARPRAAARRHRRVPARRRARCAATPRR